MRHGFNNQTTVRFRYISLSAFQVLIRGQSTPVLNLVINTSDCTGGFGYLDGTTNDVQFSAKATNSATLTGTVSAHGCAYDGSGMLLSCTDHAVDINLEWTATGAVARGQFINHIQGPDGMSIERSLGVTAPADATGTVKEDGNLDLISGVSTYAYIYSLDYGSLTITRP